MKFAEIERSEWLGGSDWPALIGRSSFTTAFALYLEKKGVALSVSSENDHIVYGNLMEPKIREYINETLGLEYQERAFTRPLLKLRGNLDGWDENASQPILEIKTNSDGQVKKYYKDQCDFYSLVTGKRDVLLAVYKKPPDFYKGFDASYREEDFDLEFDPRRLTLKVYKAANPKKQKMIREISAKFMEMVDKDKVLEEKHFNYLWKGFLNGYKT